MESYRSSSTCFESGKSVYSEIMWGSKFRKRAREARRKSSEKKCADKKPKCKVPNPCAKMDALFAALNAEGKKHYADPFRVIRREEMLDKMTRKGKKKKKGTGKKKSKVVNRDLLTRRQHIELLSRPRVIPQDNATKPDTPKRKKKVTKRCREDSSGTETSPRLRQLALPSKRLVYANWSQYQHVLDADTVERMESILVAGKGENLDTDETKRYFKSKDKKNKRKSGKKASKLQKRKQKTKKKWLKNEVNILADLIVHSFAREPLQADKNSHIQLTNCIIATLRFKGFRVKPISRNTKSLRKRTVLGIFDHISVWSDRIFQEAELLDLEISVRRYEKMLQRFREQEEAAAKEAAAKRAAEEQKTRNLDNYDELSNMRNEDIVDTLIRLLESGDSKDLDAVIHGELLPDVTYKKLLEKLRQMRKTDEDLVSHGRIVQPIKQEFLKWTQLNRPLLWSKEVKGAIGALSKCLLKVFVATKAASSSQKVQGKEKEPPEELHLMSLDEDVVLSDIETYRDPNEDFEEDPMPDTLTDDENGFDQSMYVGNQDMVEEVDDEGEG